MSMTESRRNFSLRGLDLIPFLPDAMRAELVASARLTADLPGTGSPADQKARYFTDAEFKTQDNRTVRFYTDLLQGKKVLINFMYRECSNTCPRTTANLVAVQRDFGSRVGRDVFFISISLRPDVDTPAALKAYAADHGCGPGWTFLCGAMKDVDVLRRKLGLVDNPDITQHVGLLTFGNEPAARWGTTNALASPEHIAWVVRNRIDGWSAEPWPSRSGKEK
jgi:protein SCO1/2